MNGGFGLARPFRQRAKGPVSFFRLGYRAGAAGKGLIDGLALTLPKAFYGRFVFLMGAILVFSLPAQGRSGPMGLTGAAISWIPIT
jgi:hypothetical protein